MGAGNVAAAFRRWAGRVPGTSMQVLTYMALVSKDKDDWPWFGQGQEALAEFALGRENPDRTDVRAVSRAMQPLLDAGAVTVDRAAAARTGGNSTARYRLNLTDEADGERRKWKETCDEKRRKSKPAKDPQRTTESGHDVRRKVAQRTTVSDATYDGNRRTKEEEDQEEQENQGIRGDLRTAVTLAREPRAEAEPAPVVELFPGASQEARYRPPPRWSTSAMTEVEAATERRRARIAEHQAQLASGETT